MIDFDSTLPELLAGIEWQPQRGQLSLSDLADERVYGSPQCHLSLEWRPSEPNVVLRLFCLYLKTFPHASFDSLYYDLGSPVKHGTGNAIKRGNGNDHAKSVFCEHYFTKYGVVVAITDQGKGFDFREAFALFERKAKYFTYYGKGFRRFAKCRSKISYENGGRTLLIQYRVDSAPPAPSRQCFAAAADGPPPFEIVESLSKTTVSCLYLLARCEPELLRGVWKSSAFLETYIFPALPDQRQPARAALTSSSELTDVTKRGVAIRYRIADDVILAKFLRRDLQGAQTYEILRAAWSGGLGAGQPYQVPRPLAYYPDRRLLLTMAIDGVALDQSLAGDIDELIRACQDAARWLLKFHATPLEAGAEHGDSRNGRAQTLSAQAAPNDGRRTLEQNEAYAGLVRDLWAELELRAEAERQLTRAVVPIHGKFGPENVLLSDGITAAINFDRSRLDEPALDLARFMLQLWKRIFKDTGQWKRAEIAANAFLTEYGSAKPEILASLPYYWGEKILKSLEHHTGHPSYRGLNESLDQVVRFHEAQFKFAGRCEAGMPRL